MDDSLGLALINESDALFSRETCQEQCSLARDRLAEADILFRTCDLKIGELRVTIIPSPATVAGRLFALTGRGDPSRLDGDRP